MSISEAEQNDQLMSRRRVLVVAGDCLFSAGLQNILSLRTNLEVHAVIFKDIPDLIVNIQSFNPGVVILDEIYFLANPTDLLEAFLSFPELRVIRMNIDDNRLQVYEKKQVLVRTPEDFFAEV